MNSYLLVLVLLQSLGCSGLPLHNPELQAVADSGLSAALAQVNSRYAFSSLYRVTRGSLSKVVPVGLNTHDLLMTFSVKETECPKASGNDPQTCAFRPGFFVPSLSCSTRVRMSATSTQVISLRCKHDGASSSSSSSSEEVFSRGRHQFSFQYADRAPAPSAPTQLGRSIGLHTPEEPRPRGDIFSNYLV